MNNILYLILAILILILLGVIGLLFVLVFKLLKQQKQEAPKEEASTSSHYHPDIASRISEAKKLQKNISKLSVFCPNHPEEVGETTCAICGKFFCKACLRPFKTMHFCKEHLGLVMKNEWDEVATIKSSTEDPEAGVKIIETKQKWWDQDQLPTYIETHYKINIDNDYIETYLVLFATKAQLAEVKQKVDELDLTQEI
jgi:hypothetical protein